MDRITGTAVADIGGGKRGFQDQILSTGGGSQEGTVVSAAWLNAVQEEILNVIEQSGQDPDARDLKQLAAAIQLKGRARNLQVYRGGGVTTFVVPSGIYTLYVEVYGGGGGACLQNFGTGTAHGEGGGGGGFAGGWVDVTPGQSIAVTVGGGGVTSGSGSNGTAGGTSSFGSFMSATGGGGAVTSGGPGDGGIGVGGQINLSGGGGFDGNDNYPALFAFGGDAAGPMGGKGGRSVGRTAKFPGGGAGIVQSGSVAAADASTGGVFVRW